MTGTKMSPDLNSPFNRFTHDIANHPEFHEDVDRPMSFELDSPERLKPFAPKKGTTIGNWQLQPLEDRDDKFFWTSIEGDHLFADPPDSNAGPAVDHRMDEEQIWNFPISVYNQKMIENEWASNPWNAMKKSYIPYWSQKLLAPDYFTKEKWDNMQF